MYIMQPDQLLSELDSTTKTILAMESLLARLVDKQSSLAATLDALTKPVAVPLPPPRKETRKGFSYRGEFSYCNTCVGLHRQVLRMLWQEFPSRQEAMAAAVSNAGYNRCYIASDRNNLFLLKSRRWTMKFSEEFFPGWYMDTNVTPERIKRILPLIVRAAGLEWNKDFAMNWN